MVFQVQADDGSLMDAHFEVDGNSILFHSRSGAAPGRDGRNADYSPALRLLLERLSRAGVPVEKAWVDSARVQSIAVDARTILDERDAGLPPSEQFSRMASRMQAVGRSADAKSGHGNSTKRIRLQLPTAAGLQGVATLLRGVPSQRDFRSADRLPAIDLQKVTPEHLWHAVQRLQAGYTDHAFSESTDYDVLLENGVRLAPKAVFGLAATGALGHPIQPRHFTAGIGSTCFTMLESSGYTIVPKGEGAVVAPVPDVQADREWSEGTPRLRSHLRRERSAGLREAKKAEFRRNNSGKLFCEKCGLDPVDRYASEDGEACIEVHHKRVQVSEMDEGHLTTLEDLQCLCANCHRVEHRLIRKSLILSS